jgi:hypothetical protein
MCEVVSIVGGWTGQLSATASPAAGASELQPRNPTATLQVAKRQSIEIQPRGSNCHRQSFDPGLESMKRLRFSHHSSHSKVNIEIGWRGSHSFLPRPSAHFHFHTHFHTHLHTHCWAENSLATLLLGRDCILCEVWACKGGLIQQSSRANVMEIRAVRDRKRPSHRPQSRVEIAGQCRSCNFHAATQIRGISWGLNKSGPNTQCGIRRAHQIIHVTDLSIAEAALFC